LVDANHLRKAVSGLQVDRQTKGSYTTREAAEEASLAIKRAFPILHVAVFDTEEGQSTAITFPES
jgi:hypothetical protein